MESEGFGNREGPLSSLQKLRDLVAPGSSKEAIVERAMDYVLSDKRTDICDDFALRAVTRNARYAHYRGKERGRNALARYRSQTGAQVDAMRDIRTARPGAHVANRALAAAAVSAEECVMTAHSDFCVCTLQAAAAISPAAEAFVRHLMDGDSVPEAARAVGMSRATAYRVVGTLRGTVPNPVTAAALK